MKLAIDDVDRALDYVQVSLFVGLGEFYSASAVNLFTNIKLISTVILLAYRL